MRSVAESVTSGSFLCCESLPLVTFPVEEWMGEREIMISQGGQNRVVHLVPSVFWSVCWKSLYPKIVKKAQLRYIYVYIYIYTEVKLNIAKGVRK